MAEGGFRVKVDLDAGRLAHRARVAARVAEAEAGAEILRRASALAPRRTGALVGSGAVATHGDGARVGYGAVYARIQHDGTSFRHPGGGQAGFLSAPAEDPAALRAMAEAFHREINE